MKTRESGQVLPLGLVLVVLGMMGALVLFNTGQVATDKMRLANSADAAAYSGALFQARALNYQAYSNRAMVANQVAIAQAVSIRSWMRYAEGAADNLATITSWIPYLNAGTRGLRQGVASADSIVGAAADIYVGVASAITIALSVSQTAMQGAAILATEDLIDVVAKETDSRFETNSAYAIGQIAYRALQWDSFYEQYTKQDKDQMLERTKLVMESRDGFTRARNWSFGHVPVSLKRQGETQLVAFEGSQGLVWEWVAKDTLSTHIGVDFGWFGSASFETPMAWATAFANNSNNRTVSTRRRACRGFGPYQTTEGCGHFTEDNDDAERLADLNILSLNGTETRQAMRGYQGLQSFWDLSSDARARGDAKLEINVEVSMPLKDVSESNEIFHSSETHNAVVASGKTLSSLGAAHVFYRRPNHYDLDESEREKANSYNPYWQAQLTTSSADRLLAIPIREGGITPTAYGAPLEADNTTSSSLGYYELQ